MNRNDYILATANLPFVCLSHYPNGRKLLDAAPGQLWDSLNAADTHEEEVKAGDAISEWIAANWRTVLPEVAKTFPITEVA